MVCDYEFSDSTIKVNCLGCIFSSSIEDSDVCMAKTIDKLLERKGVGRVVLAQTRETEYDFEQVKILQEIANVYNKIVNEEKIINSENLFLPGCEKIYPKRMDELRFLIHQVLRKDPIGAWIKLNLMIIRVKRLIEKASSQEKGCNQHYLEHALEPIKEILESTQLIKLVKPRLSKFRFGDRNLYREIFSPVVRPSFMLTSFMVTSPKGGQVIDKYWVGSTLVQIFKIPGKVRYIYHITPREFKLSEKKYIILDSAKEHLAEHKPTGAEAIEPEKSREIFLGIGRDLIKDLARDMKVSLTKEEIENLASILNRYTAGFGVLELLLSDEKIQDININSPIGLTPIYIYHSHFEECETNLIPTKEDAEAWATRFRLYSGRPLDEANPVLDTELSVPGGRARVCAITRTLSPMGLAYAFRRHREKPWTFPLFMQAKFFDSLYAGLMSFVADGGRALLIAGGRSAGKTSLLSALLLEIMRKFRMVLIEDTLELPVDHMRGLGYNIERMKSRSVITRVETELPPDEALRTALRLGDSCLIVGEVRSVESTALFEAMRIGALANVVAGTIHGESPYGVYDRVVHDLGVPPTSFKALDLITICSMLRSPDGLHRFRRVTDLTEVRKKWKVDPADEGGFVPLMQYSAKEDMLKPTDVLIDGESEVLNEIAKRVREWHGAWDLVWDNILLRGKIKQTQVDFARNLKRPEILEAGWIVESNEAFHLICDQVREEIGSLDSKLIYNKWLEWFKEKLKKNK